MARRTGPENKSGKISNGIASCAGSMKPTGQYGRGDGDWNPKGNYRMVRRENGKVIRWGIGNCMIWKRIGVNCTK
ncbi:hypothetical protein [Membranihabitans maritimus]|uniref:hypothetical protein n=1 Tax=Membranihabitans maritimus TaxID=2904244 RepID=UPI001F21A4F3|nr:hypothetical protein [Membranihabitans maritimus]